MKRLLLAAVLLTSACARPKPGQPPEIVFGRHECARCGMILSEERYAAGYVNDNGEAVAFDDLGELLAEIDEHPELKSRSWARDFKGGEWLPLDRAYLIRIEGLATPMGTGWVAFGRAEDGEAFLRSRAGG